MRGTTGEPGIIPLAVAEIFQQINNMLDREFLLRVSYMEVKTELNACHKAYNTHLDVKPAPCQYLCLRLVK